MDSPLDIVPRIGERLVSQGLWLATAESCTGGGIAQRITCVPGSSDYFLGGVVAYSNAVKVALLGVSQGNLDQFGAVSEPVARQMAEGVRRRLDANIAVATTGIAGPTGGTPDKPVGLVYIALADGEGTIVLRREFARQDDPADGAARRRLIQERTIEDALNLIGERIA